MDHDHITELSTDLPNVAELPEPPEVGELHTPDDLRPLHRQLIAQAAELAGHNDTGEWTTAAAKVTHLWHAWRNRMHATAAHPAMREAANQATQAVMVGLRTGDQREARRWFTLADGWINDLRMQADPVGLAAPRRPDRLSHRVLAGLFGRPR